MTFEEILDQAIAMVQRHGRVTYRALKAQFQLNDDLLDVLKDQLLFAYPVADEDGRGLVWTGDPAAPEPEVQQPPDAETRFQASLRAVMWQLQCDRRVTYRTLKHTLGLNDALFDDIRKELGLRCLAIDEGGEVLVWTGESRAVNVTSVEPSELAVPVAANDTITPGAPQDESDITTEPVHTTPEAERRQLTVMFCDLADSTKLSQQLDPEDLREVVRAYQATAAEVIEQYDGHIAQYLGDGLLIYFGWPVAHEDDAQRAAHAGLGIVEVITSNLNPHLERDKGVQLTVRIGIHTGPVVVGEMGGSGRHENLATGETVNIAARLEGLAAPNTVVISTATAHLVEGAFGLEVLGLHNLKGVAEPMQVFRILGHTEADVDEDESVVADVPFLVGRDEEVGLLLRRWEQSKEGLGQVVLIRGEAGIGKSSLVATVRHHVLQAGYTRIAFRCSPYHTNSALYPVIEHVQRVLQFEPGDTPATRLDKLERVLKTYSRPLQDVVPLYAALLSVTLPEGHYATFNLSPQQQRQQTQDALVGWLLEEAERHPTLAMWEDLHWADPSTLEMLGLVLEQTPTVPMLHVLTYRPEFEPPWPSRSHMTPITLNRLEGLQVEALISHLTDDKRLPEEVVEHIVTKTDGVPLYVEELTKMLLKSDLIREETEQYVLTGPLVSVTIPDTLQDSLMARLDQMNTAKEVAQLGAVLGRAFSYEMLLAIASQDDETIEASLAQLVEAELLYQRGRPPRARYMFKHALIQDAAYASLLKSVRQRVHQRIARLLERRFPDVVETQPELVAHHFTEAGEDDDAIRYWQQAGQHALQRSANAEAIAHLTKGLAVLTTLPATPTRLQQELDLQVALGTALYATQGYAAPEVERVYARARELCEQIGDTPQLFPVLRGLINHYMVGGRLQTAFQLAEQLLRLAQSQPEPAHLLLAHHMLGIVLFFLGELVSAHTHHKQVLTIYNPQAHRALAVRYGLDLGVASGSWLPWELWQLGYPDQAMQHGQAALTLPQEVSHLYSLALALVFAAFLHQCRRETLAVHKQAEAAITLTTEQGFAYWLACGTVLHGWARAVQGQGEAGIAEIRQGVAAILTTGDKVLQTYFLGLLAEAYGEHGHPEAGVNALDEALAVVDDTEARFFEAELYRLKGSLLLKQAVTDAPQAEVCFHQALSIARRQQAKSWELRAAASLARLWQSQGKRREAYDLLAPVYGWFTEGFDTADLREAKGLLQELNE